MFKNSRQVATIWCPYLARSPMLIAGIVISCIVGGYRWNLDCLYVGEHSIQRLNYGYAREKVKHWSHISVMKKLLEKILRGCERKQLAPQIGLPWKVTAMENLV